jgi:hypothetical protein
MKCLITLFVLILLGCNQHEKTKGFFGSDPKETIIDEFEAIVDPNEAAFTVNMPKGWKSKVSLERVYSQTRNCGVSNSPDGKTRLFFGDPSFTIFNLPAPEYGMYEGAQTGNPLSQVKHFVPADQFFREYADMAFGNNKQFKIVSVTTDEELKKE